MIIRTVGDLRKQLEGVSDETPINYEDGEYMMDAGYDEYTDTFDISGTDADEYGRA